MSIRTARAFFGWCALINYWVLLVWLAIVTLGHDWIMGISLRCFEISKGQFDAVDFSCMAGYKAANILLFFVPFLGLSIVLKLASSKDKE